MLIGCAGYDSGSDASLYSGTPGDAGEDVSPDIIPPPGDASSDSGDGGSTGADGGSTGADGGSTTAGAAPGSRCNCDADCSSVGANQGICYFGICVTKPLASSLPANGCQPNDRETGCPSGSRCYDNSLGQSLCFLDCQNQACTGECNSSGLCTPAYLVVEEYWNHCVYGCSGSVSECVSAECAETCDVVTSPLNPGSVCSYDQDCKSFEDNRGVCVSGICMTEYRDAANEDCPTPGATEGCPSGSRCWNRICFPDADATVCRGFWDINDSCVSHSDSCVNGEHQGCLPGFRCWSSICWPDGDATDGNCSCY